MIRLKLLLALGLTLCVTFRITESVLAAMSIDLGSEFIKVGIVKPGVPMEIVLNRESQRKTASQVCIRNQERFFGDRAVNMRVRFPTQVYGYIIDLLGKKFDHPSVHLFQQRFPYYKLIPDQNRGTVLFENEKDTYYSVEELLAMIISEIRSFAEAYAEQIVKDAIITVPAFFNQAERRAVVAAAKMAGINLLQLMNDNTAAGVNYGMFRRKEFNDTDTIVMIYDMGATKTTATVYRYRLVQDKVTREKNPQMTILGVGYDRTLGGLEITFRLRDHLIKLFNEKFGKKIKTKIEEDPKSMNKLLKEAERVKKVLSANPDHFAQVESLHENIDFRVKITRQELEDLIEDILERVPQPALDALKMTELPFETLDYVILMGGGTRSQKVQEKLQAALGGKDLSKYLNTDEAIAMGAVYQAAHRSKGFKVKKFGISELNLYPIVVDFQKESAPAEKYQKPTSEESSKSSETGGPAMIRRVLFSYKNPYPQKKVMTFSKHVHDFEFIVNYGDLHLTPEQLKYFGELNISRVEVRDVEEHVSKKVAIEGVTYKGAKAHFRLDESGILQLENADVSFETLAPAEPEDTTSTLKKLGMKISSLFSGSGDEKAKEEKEKEKEKDKETSEEKENDDKKSADEKSDGSKQEQETGDKKTGEEPKTETNAEASNKTESATNATKTAQPKLSVEKLKLKLEKSYIDFQPISKDQMKESVSKLKKFEEIEKAKKAQEEAKNDLESLVMNMKRKIDSGDYKTWCSKDECENIMAKCVEIEEWLEMQDAKTPIEDIKAKMKIIKDASRELMYKLEEAKERPRAVETLEKILNYSNVFLTGMRNFTGEEGIFTEVELNTLEKLIVETTKWWADKQEEQSKLAISDKPAITVGALAEKITALDREVNYLINKAKLTPPKPKKPAPTAEESKEKAEKSSEKEEKTTKKDEKMAEKEEKSTENEETGEKTKEETAENPGKQAESGETDAETSVEDEKDDLKKSKMGPGRKPEPKRPGDPNLISVGDMLREIKDYEKATEPERQEAEREKSEREEKERVERRLEQLERERKEREKYAMREKAERERQEMLKKVAEEAEKFDGKAEKMEKFDEKAENLDEKHTEL